MGPERAPKGGSNLPRIFGTFHPVAMATGRGRPRNLIDIKVEDTRDGEGQGELVYFYY